MFIRCDISSFFFFNDTATTEIYTLSLHDALPISFACIAAGIACLWGPAHGGANEAALAMLSEIGTVDKIPEFIAKVKDKNSEVRLMGFGHRVYKNYDPRAKIMQKMCHAVLAETGHGDDPML